MLRKIPPAKLSDDECDCPCHSGRYVVHITACCTRCPYCGRNIRWHLMQTSDEQPIAPHIMRCPRKPNSQLN